MKKVKNNHTKYFKNNGQYPINFSVTKRPPIIKINAIMCESIFHKDNGYLVGITSKPIFNLF